MVDDTLHNLNLASPEVTVLVAFMQTLRQPPEAVARNATVPAVASAQTQR